MRKFVFITIAITLFTFSITAKKNAVYSIPLTLVENNVSKYSE